jgi:hypothetical protein
LKFFCWNVFEVLLSLLNDDNITDSKIRDILSNNTKDAQALNDYVKSGKCRNKIVLDIFKRLEDYPNNRLQALTSEFLTPEQLRLKLVIQGNALPAHKECWFSGKAILINARLFREILRELAKNKFPIHPSYKDLLSGLI